MNSEGREQNTATAKVGTVCFPVRGKWWDCRDLSTPQYKMLTLAPTCGRLTL